MDRVDSEKVSESGSGIVSESGSEIVSESGSEIVSESGSEIVNAPPVSSRACATAAQVSRKNSTSRAFEMGVGMVATSTGDVNLGRTVPGARASWACSQHSILMTRYKCAGQLPL